MARLVRLAVLRSIGVYLGLAHILGVALWFGAPGPAVGTTATA